MQCIKPVTLHGQKYNCGNCTPCRINRTSEWTLRNLYELSKHFKDGASFITLTYDDEHLPKDNGLHPEELQQFWKRLRINFKRQYREFAPKLRYFACGEYGSKEETYWSPGAEKPHGRPHFHAIVYGLNNYDDLHRKLLVKSWDKCDPFLFDKSRGRNSGMQEVTVDDIRYVCGYVQKKLNGDYAKEKYGEAHKPFNTCSQGIGLEFALENKQRLLDNGFTYLKGHKIGIPRYFCKKFGVFKGQLIKETVVDTEKTYQHLQKLFKVFEEDMKKQGTWYPDNEKMTRFRFEKWYDTRQFEIAKSIEKNYQDSAKIRGAKI